MAIWTDLLVNEALARAARTQLDQVVIALDERNQPGQVKQLTAMGEVLVSGLEAERAQQKVDPFVAGERLARFLHRANIARRQLNRLELVDEERSGLPFEDEAVVVSEGDLGP